MSACILLHGLNIAPPTQFQDLRLSAIPYFVNAKHRHDPNDEACLFHIALFPMKAGYCLINAPKMVATAGRRGRPDE
jgi:hypothetical protein